LALMKKYSFLLFGTGFGFLLSRAGATTYDYYAKLFLFEDFQLLWIIAAAAAVGALGVALLKANKARSVFERKPIAFLRKPYKRSLLPGALVFGLGWGLAGACPGTVLAMLGEGKLGALFTITGIALGTFLYGLKENKTKRAAQKTSPPSHLGMAPS
jgi:uncharacterized membrane protein YedE/YeeE